MEDLTGKRFGRLVVVGHGPDYINPNNNCRWVDIPTQAKNKRNSR